MLLTVRVIALWEHRRVCHAPHQRFALRSCLRTHADTQMVTFAPIGMSMPSHSAVLTLLGDTHTLTSLQQYRTYFLKFLHTL
jgi:hypothetical protein